MLRPLRHTVIAFLSGLFLSLLIPYISYGQACNGADGTGIYFGSVANVDNGTICANTPILPAVMEIDIRNVSELYGAISYFIDWQDGTTQTVPATKIATSRFFASVAHTFPPNGGNVRCEYRPTVQIKYASVATPCAASLGVPPRFVRWNTDDQNTGQLEVDETVTGRNVYEVCAGVQTNVTFTDRSILNCVPPALTIGQNDKMRWRRFDYGTANTITGTVLIGGTPHGYPYSGAVDASTEPTLNSGFPTSTTQIITVPATAQVGEYFEITMDYWNTCNPYPARTPVSRTARILIVAQPPAPTSTNQTVCNGVTPSNFALGGVPGGNLVTWYRNVPGAPDAPGTQISQGTSTSLPITSVPGYVNNTTAGVYKVWASYRPNVANALNCESPLIPITRTIREVLTVPNPTTAPPQYICTGSSFAVGLTGPASTTVGGATEYIFGTTAGITLGSSTANSATYNVAVAFTPGQLYVDKTITISRRYTPSSACQVDRNFTIRVYNNPAGGTPSNFPDVCDGTPIGPIDLTGQVGVVKRWEIKIDSGPWNTYTGPANGSLTQITPGILPAGAGGTTYYFRAIVGNPTTSMPTSYPCTDAISSVESVLVSPSPSVTVNAGVDQSWCNILSTNMTALPATPGIGTWSYLSSVPSGRPSPSFTPNNEVSPFSITAGNEGSYTMRWTVISGSCTFIDDVVIDFGKSPVVAPMTDLKFCGETGALAAVPLTVGTGAWTCIGGACAQVDILDPTSPTSDVTLKGPAFSYGLYTFKWTVTSGSCPTDDENVNVTFFEPPTVTAADFAGPCLSSAGGTTINLSGTFGTGATSGAWTIVAGSGSIGASSVAGNTVTATYTSSALDYSNGTPLTFKLTATPPAASNCLPVNKDINVTVDRTPVIPPMAAISTCNSFYQLAAQNPIPYLATGKWTTPTAGVTFDDDTNPTTFVRNLPAAPSSITLTWTLTSNGANLCTNFATVGVTRAIAPNSANLDLILCADPAPALPNTVSVRLADYETTVTSLPIPSRTIAWYQDASPPSGIPVADPTVTFTNVPDGKIYIARITETATGCTSDAVVSINVRGIPTANHGIVALCEDTPGSNTASNVDLTDVTFKDAVTNGSNVVTWFHSALGAKNNDPLDQITAPMTVVSGITVYARVSYSSGAACVNTTPLDLSVKPLPTNTAILGRATVCQGDPLLPPSLLPVETYQVTPIPGAKYFWTIPTGPGQFREFGGGATTDFFVLLQFPNVVNPGIDIKVRIELNGCSTPDIPLNIRVTPQPVKPIIAGPDIVCENDDGLLYNVNPTNFPSSNYTWEIRKVSDNSLGGAFIKSGQGTDQIAVKYSSDPIYISVKEVNSICVSDTAQYWVAVNRRPIMFDPNPDPEVCSGSPINIVFAADGTSPVAIDRYDINLFSRQSATLNFVVPAGGPVFPSPGVAANAIQNHTFENLQAIPLSVKYNVTPISEKFAHVCPGQPVDIVVVIKPEPQLDPSLGRSICSEQETGITLLSAANTFPADKFVITALTVPAGVTPVGALPAADGVTLYNDDIIFHNAFINTTGVNKTVQYDIAPYSSLLGCLGDPPTPINVVIYPQTIVDAVVIPPICNGDPLNVSFTSTNNPDATFEWLVKTYDPNINVLSTGAGAGNITNMLIVNTSNTIDGTVTFEVRGKNPPTEDSPDGCDNPPLTFVVTIKHSPVANAQNLSACSDVPGGNTYTADLTTLATFVNPDAGTPAVNLVWYHTDPRLGPAVVITTAELPAFVMNNASPIFVEVEDATNGCKKVASIQYTINPSIQANITKTDLSCFGNNSGSIRVDIAPGTGTPAFSYRIDGGPFINAGASTYTFNSLAAANHSIEVQDSKGCGITQLIPITEPAALNASLTIDQGITCFLGSDGQISTQATGGTLPYASFLLLQTNTTNATGVFPNLTLGSYSVRVTDAKGCKVDTAPIPLPQPAAVEINNVSVLTDANGFNLSCRDAVDGAIAVTFSGGNTPPNYTITMTKASDPLNPININTPTSPANFTNLGFGNYSIIAKDAKGCPSLPASAIIVNPPPFSPGFVGINQSICVGDDAVAIQQLVPAFGGVGNYQYQWQQSLTGSMIDADWINIPGATSTTYDPAILAQTTYFRRIARSVSVRTGVACQELGKDNIVQVLINPLPAVIFSAPSEVCQGESFSLSINMTGGAAPIEYDYSAGSTTFQNLIGTENTFIPVSNFQAPQTYTLLRVKDLNGCLSPNVPQAVNVDIIKLNPDFQVLAPSEQCSGGTFTFQWVAEAGVKYTWIWSDGQQTIINPGERPLGTNTITHVFTSGSTDASTIYPVRLQAENALCSPKFATKPITVYPNVILNILPGDPTLCSGESIRFIDQSNGVDVGKWYYHVIGSTDQLEMKAGPVPDITYTMTNITTTNPIDYEVVYEAANNEGCTATYKLPVKVFRNILAVIGNNPDPPTPFTGGISTVEFVNNSNPLDAGDFDYTWDFGDARAQPAAGTGVDPITVNYFSAGIKDVRLTAVNIAAKAANKTCQSTVVKKINIELPMLGAAFKATPLASCFPVNIKVTNLSPGADTFAWEVYNESGLVTTSNLREPEFRILTPGVYDIYLTASFYATGQTATASQKGIEVYDVPTALFEMRPNPLYVPDTELQTFNQSARATSYLWDFDDGTTSTEFQPRHLYQLEGKYMITLIAGYDHGPKDIDGDGIIDGNVVCYDTVRNELVARDGGFVKLPNAFTPSPNGPNGGVAGSGTFNDVFLPIARGVEEFSMQVFDRWGNLVFESKDRNIGWDGYDRNHRLMPAGVYVYKLILRLSNGQRTTKIGDVTLIR